MIHRWITVGSYESERMNLHPPPFKAVGAAYYLRCLLFAHYSQKKSVDTHVSFPALPQIANSAKINISRYTIFNVCHMFLLSPFIINRKRSLCGCVATGGKLNVPFDSQDLPARQFSWTLSSGTQ